MFIGSKAILGSLANESPRWLAALACPPLRPAATFTGSLALLGSLDILLSAITMVLTIRLAQTDIKIEVDGAIKGMRDHFEREQINSECNKERDALAGSYSGQSF